MNVGKSIKKFRIEKGYQQNAFAKMIGLSSTSLSLIETGKKRPSAKTMQEICRVLEIKESVLIILSLEKEDVPESKQAIFEQMFPHIKSILLDISREEEK